MKETTAEDFATSQSHIVVRLMGPQDEALGLASLSALKQKADVHAMSEYLRSSSDFLAVAFIEEIPAGFARGHYLRRLDGSRPKFMLYELETSPQFRRRGVGRALMHKMLEIARSVRALKMFVLTDESNSAAMSLYESTGGIRLRRDDVLFEFDLSKTGSVD